MVVGAGVFGAGVADGDEGADADGLTARAPAVAAAEAVLVDAFVADGVGDADGPLHPAANTHKSSTAQTANVAARFCINVTPRKVMAHFRYTQTSVKVHKASALNSFDVTPRNYLRVTRAPFARFLQSHWQTISLANEEAKQMQP